LPRVPTADKATGRKLTIDERCAIARDIRRTREQQQVAS
jgi:hypothetical protein